MNKSKKSVKKRSTGWKYFDECPICQAMKEGRANTIEELKKAFDEANLISDLKSRKNKK